MARRSRTEADKAEWKRIVTLAAKATEAAKPEPPRPPMAFGYRRCSHEDSRQSGLRLDIQAESINGYYSLLRTRRPELAELPWGELYSDEAVSAYRKRLIHRKEGGRLNAELKRGDHVIIPRLDRGFRSLEDQMRTLNDWRQRGVTVHFVNEQIDPGTSMGQLIMAILGAVNEWQSAYLSDRAKEVGDRMEALGRTRTGKAPLGFRLVGPKGKRRMLVDERARRVMKEIVRVRDKHGWTWGKISDYIEEKTAEWEKRETIAPYDQGQRKWNWQKCSRAYKQEKKLQGEE